MRNQVIDSFTGQYKFLSNFYPCSITYRGLTYRSSEAAFQAMKCQDRTIRKRFTALRPDTAKRLGREVLLRCDWDEVKEKFMHEILRKKFKKNHKDQLWKLLDGTKNKLIVEGNMWHDNIWGMCFCHHCIKYAVKRENKLGNLLMKVRSENRK